MYQNKKNWTHTELFYFYQGSGSLLIISVLSTRNLKILSQNICFHHFFWETYHVEGIVSSSLWGTVVLTHSCVSTYKFSVLGMLSVLWENFVKKEIIFPCTVPLIRVDLRYQSWWLVPRKGNRIKVINNRNGSFLQRSREISHISHQGFHHFWWARGGGLATKAMRGGGGHFYASIKQRKVCVLYSENTKWYKNIREKTTIGMNFMQGK